MSSYQKHLTYQDRLDIQKFLNDDFSMKDIALSLHKDASTISKEIKKRRFEKKTDNLYQFHNLCQNYINCNLSHVCPSHIVCQEKLCKRCNICQSVCIHFKPDLCKRLLKSPHVCNGCNIKTKCKKKMKYFYYADIAQKSYDHILKDSRSGINLSETQFKQLNCLLSPLIISNSQPLSHIFATHNDEIPCGLRTIYNYIEAGYMSCKNIDLPRKVSYKPRKKNNSPKRNTKELRKNRTYSDYIQYITHHPETSIIEMDTVEGKKDDGPLLLTLHCVKTSLQISHLIPNKEKENVPKVFELYREVLGEELFHNFFELILADNGAEFADIDSLEKLGCQVFFCDPCRADQKGACEKNHEYIRCFYPKGKTFIGVKQSDVWKMMSHINSIRRPNLNNKSPYEVTSFIWGEELLTRLHIRKIAPDNVVLNTTLFK